MATLSDQPNKETNKLIISIHVLNTNIIKNSRRIPNV